MQIKETNFSRVRYYFSVASSFSIHQKYLVEKYKMGCAKVFA